MSHQDIPPLRDPFAMDSEDDVRPQANDAEVGEPIAARQLPDLRDPFARELTPPPATPVPASYGQRTPMMTMGWAKSRATNRPGIPGPQRHRLRTTRQTRLGAERCRDSPVVK